VGRVANDLLSPNSSGFLQPRADGLGAFASEAEQVRRDQQRPLPIAALNRERLGGQRVGDGFERRLAGGGSSHWQGLGRRDIRRGQAHLPVSGLGRQQRWKCQC